MTCSNCRGYGNVWRGNFDSRYLDPCPVCKGHGELNPSKPPAPTYRENQLKDLQRKAEELRTELAQVETAIRWTQAMLGEDP